MTRAIRYDFLLTQSLIRLEVQEYENQFPKRAPDPKDLRRWNDHWGPKVKLYPAPPYISGTDTTIV
jgi:hypothetical protein